MPANTYAYLKQLGALLRGREIKNSLAEKKTMIRKLNHFRYKDVKERKIRREREREKKDAATLSRKNRKEETF